MKPKLWPVSGREVTQHPPESLNFSSSKIISFWRRGNLSQSAACLQQVAGGAEGIVAHTRCAPAGVVWRRKGSDLFVPGCSGGSLRSASIWCCEVCVPQMCQTRRFLRFVRVLGLLKIKILEDKLGFLHSFNSSTPTPRARNMSH
jgi:hypothetical protein